MGDNQADSHRRGNDTSRSWQFGPACLRLLFLICLALLCLLLTDSGNREAEAQTGYDTHFLVTGNDQPGLSGKTYFYSDLDQEINLSLLVMNVASTNQTVELNGTARKVSFCNPSLRYGSRWQGAIRQARAQDSIRDTQPSVRGNSLSTTVPHPISFGIIRSTSPFRPCS